MTNTFLMQQRRDANQFLKDMVKEIWLSHYGRRFAQHLCKRHILSWLRNYQPDNLVVLQNWCEVQLMLIGYRDILLAFTLHAFAESDVGNQCLTDIDH